MNKEELHRFRQIIDECIVIANIDIHSDDWKEGYPVYSREIEIAKMKLQEAKMWVGKCLEKLGHELPKEFQDKVEE